MLFLKVLAIGNSFSQDATRYLHQIAKADGFDVEVLNLYIGGCSLEMHVNNINVNASAYEYQLNGERSEKKISILDALLSDKWDIVTLQQVSTQSVDYKTYQPFLNELSEYVKRCASKAMQIIHQTWSYEEGSEKLCQTMGYNTQKEMFEDLERAYNLAAKDLGGLKIIPSGKAFQKAIEYGLTNLHRDTFHASLGIGRYILGLTWYKTLTGNDIEKNSFNDFDEPVSEEEIAIAKKVVSAL